MQKIYKTTALLLALLTPMAAHCAEIYVHYDAGWGSNIEIRGSGGGLNWNNGTAADWTSGNAWHLTTANSGGEFQFKPLLNDQSWSVGADYNVPAADAEVHIWPFFNHNGSTLVQFSFRSQILSNSRTIRVLLPPSYHENTLKSYPVLYMHDGQNLFSAASASFGVEWQVDETSQSLIYQGAMQEAIIVGMDNSGAGRINEYTPTIDAGYGGGDGDVYLDFIEIELMPYIQSNYRAKSGAENTLMMGSSLGGLISFYAGWSRSQIYGRIGAMSSSFWWDNEQMHSAVENDNAALPNSHFYIDTGGQEGNAQPTINMVNTLVNKGYVQGQKLNYFYAANGRHSEASWRDRLSIPLQYLLPWQ